MTGQGVVPHQAVLPEPVDQVLHRSRVRNVVQDLAQYAAHRRHRGQDRAFDGLASPAVRRLDPVPGAGNRDPPVLLHGDHGGQGYPLRPPHRYAIW